MIAVALILFVVGYATTALLVNEAIVFAYTDLSDPRRLSIAVLWPLALLASGCLWVWHKVTDDAPIIR